MSSTHLIISNPWVDNALKGKNKCCKEQPGIGDKLAKIAETELREDENTRKECLKQFREWIKQNPDIENCFTDDRFLLKFLRVKKFSIPMAEQTLLKYLNFRKRFKDFTSNMDYLDSDLIQKGLVFASPYRDGNGRRVIIYNVNKINPHEYTGADICKAFAITYETILANEENQILGINHVVDLDGLNASFITLFSIAEVATIIRWGEQSLPMRHKEINAVNFPTALKYVYDFVQSNIRSEKLKSRIMIHNSFTDLHKKVNKRYLPLELGGIMSAKDMLELWKEELAAKRDLLLSYDTMNLLSDRGIIRRRNPPVQDDTESLPGSFRKLEVD